MKIIYVITGLKMGGAEAITIDIANKMIERGHQVILIFLTGENQQIHRINPLLKVIGLKMKKTPLGFFKAMWQAQKIISTFSPNIVHGQMFHANIFCRCLRIFIKIPFLISTEHNKNIESKIRMLLYKLTDFLSDLNTNVSQEATTYFINQKSFNPSKSITVYNGVELNKFRKNEKIRTAFRNKWHISDNDFLFINVGRLTKAKDQATLIKAFSILVQMGISTKLIILGKGKEEDNLKNLINELSLTKSCILAGVHNNVEDFYNSADCFVLSSIWEGFPMVLIEAMSTELPIITTECGREALGDEEFIVSSGNISQLSNKMFELYNMPFNKRKMIGKNNRNRAKKFDINTICDTWEYIYKNHHFPQFHGNI